MVEDIVVIKISQLIKEDAVGEVLTNDDFMAQLQAVVEELTKGSHALVEIEVAGV